MEELKDLNEELIKATSQNQLEKVKNLVNRGANVDYTGKLGYTALHGASISGFIRIVEFLLKAGANSNIQSKDSGFTALHFAAQEGNLQIIELLIQANADVNSKDKFGNGPLWRAGKNERIGNFLIKNGADIFMENEFGISPSNSPAVAFDYIKRLKGNFK